MYVPWLFPQKGVADIPEEEQRGEATPLPSQTEGMLSPPTPILLQNASQEGIQRGLDSQSNRPI